MQRTDPPATPAADDDDDTTPDGATYLAQVERLFVEATRRGLNLSGRDVALVQRWQAGKVPLEVVARGLEAALRQWDDRRPPRSLHFARAAVEDALARHRRLHPGAGTREPSRATSNVRQAPVPTAPPGAGHAPRPPPTPALPPTSRQALAPPTTPRQAPDGAPPDPLDALAAWLVTHGRDRHREPRVRDALRAGYRELCRLTATSEAAAPSQAWRQVRSRILVALRATLRPYERAQLERKLAAEPTAAMSAPAAEAHLAALSERWLLEALDLEALLRWPPVAPPAVSAPHEEP